jgi:hypothetical protein
MLRPNKEDLVGESLIYERANGVTYARFRDDPKKSLYPGRWEIGREVKEPIFDYAEWRHLQDLAHQHPTIKKQLDKLKDLYYIVRDGE